MKKILSLVFGLVFLAACSSDDKESSIDASKLTKKWYFSTTKVFGQTIPYTDHEECGKDYIEFLTGGIVKTVDVWECESYTDTGAWALEGKKLTISFEGEIDTATITKLTATTLQISYKEDYDEDGKLETIVTTFTSN